MAMDAPAAAHAGTVVAHEVSTTLTPCSELPIFSSSIALATLARASRSPNFSSAPAPGFMVSAADGGTVESIAGARAIVGADAPPLSLKISGDRFGGDRGGCGKWCVEGARRRIPEVGASASGDGSTDDGAASGLPSDPWRVP